MVNRQRPATYPYLEWRLVAFGQWWLMVDHFFSEVPERMGAGDPGKAPWWWRTPVPWWVLSAEIIRFNGPGSIPTRDDDLLYSSPKNGKKIVSRMDR